MAEQTVWSSSDAGVCGATDPKTLPALTPDHAQPHSGITSSAALDHGAEHGGGLQRQPLSSLGVELCDESWNRRPLPLARAEGSSNHIVGRPCTGTAQQLRLLGSEPETDFVAIACEGRVLRQGETLSEVLPATSRRHHRSRQSSGRRQGPRQRQRVHKGPWSWGSGRCRSPGDASAPSNGPDRSGAVLVQMLNTTIQRRPCLPSQHRQTPSMATTARGNACGSATACTPFNASAGWRLAHRRLNVSQPAGV